MFHSAKINALFGPIFKELFERFTNILRPNILCMLKKNPKDMERHINTYMANIRTREKIEIDFSKFDKSQLQMCYETEMEVWRMLGMDEELLDLWKI